jgi:hypothetical protein
MDWLINRTNRNPRRKENTVLLNPSKSAKRSSPYHKLPLQTLAAMHRSPARIPTACRRRENISRRTRGPRRALCSRSRDASGRTSVANFCTSNTSSNIDLLREPHLCAQRTRTQRCQGLRLPTSMSSLFTYNVNTLIVGC